MAAQRVAIPDSMKHVETLSYLAGSNFQTLLNSEKLGTEYALLESQRPTMTVTLPQISPETVGQFIYLYECAVSYVGALMEINTYDQPAVQLGKDATYALGLVRLLRADRAAPLSLLFTGKTTPGDLPLLSALADSGMLVRPAVVPPPFDPPLFFFPAVMIVPVKTPVAKNSK